MTCEVCGRDLTAEPHDAFDSQCAKDGVWRREEELTGLKAENASMEDRLHDYRRAVERRDEIIAAADAGIHRDLEVSKLKAENASLLESLRAAREAQTTEARVHAKEYARAAAAEQRAEAAEKALTELLRLYDWRFVLAEREKDEERLRTDGFRAETRRMLMRYGMEKKAAWEAARAALQEAAKGRAPQAPQEAVEAEGQEAIAARAALHDEERSALLSADDCPECPEEGCVLDADHEGACDTDIPETAAQGEEK